MIQTLPWVVLSPGIAIFVSVAIFNLLGDTVAITLILKVADYKVDDFEVQIHDAGTEKILNGIFTKI